MKFLKYPNIVNHYAMYNSTQVMANMDVQYYATEKAYGLNFHVAIDREGNVQVASRTSFAEETNVPYGAVYKLIEGTGIKERALEILELDEETIQINLYGELVGGKLKGLNFEVTKNFERQLVFYDCFILEEFPPDITVTLSRTALEYIVPDFMVAPILKINTLRELLKQDLPERSQYGNTKCEGLVYKPLDAVYHIGNLKFGITFAFVKHKNPEFLEVREARQWKKKEGEDPIIELIDNCLTKTRVFNVIMKEGVPLIDEQFGYLIRRVQVDVKDEIIRENDWVDKKLLEKNIKKSGEKIVNLLRELVRDVENYKKENDLT